ncbi:MAG: hypothetical protein NPMRD1_330005 [Nitrosopumilales archaeon]|nr:MAG: hypothetical protein NPMRD1_330005 [Nitrosopumilales archaeon]
MEHVYFSDGNTKRISWVVKTGDKVIEEERVHTNIYLDKVNDEQSKYIAIHAGIFWSIGRFIIKNEDAVKIMLDSKSMFEHLSKEGQNLNAFIQERTRFLKQFLEQRKLKIEYQLIDSKDNLASKLL